MTSESTENPPTADGGYVAVDDDPAAENGGESLFAPSIREFPWVAAAASGAIAFTAQYVLYTLTFVFGPLSSAADTLMERLTTYAFVLFASHHVPVVRSAEGVTLYGPSRINMITDAANTTLPVPVYLAVPVVALLIAGAVFERRRTDAGEGTVEGAAIVGLGHVGGYLPLGLLASFVFVSTTTFDGGSVTEAVDRLYVLSTMVAYPMIAATAGALAVRLYEDFAA